MQRGLQMARVRIQNKQPRIRKVTTTVSSDKREIKRVQKRKLAKLPLLGLKVPMRIKKIMSFITPSYFINAWREVRQVTWPSRSETRRLTLAVFVFATIFGIVVAIVDMGLDEFFKKVVLK